VQLREKQKVKRIYGVLEQQFRLYFKRAARSRGVTGEMLLQLLERRLDNVVFRLCFASSRQEGRQRVCHGYIEVNGKRVDIPSYTVKKGDVITVRAKRTMHKSMKEQLEVIKERGVPKWLNVDHDQLRGEVADVPQREDVGFPIKEQLIVELYSK
jgi:small subunit ribosomal protein S4